MKGFYEMDNDVNISPDMINNLVNMLKNNTNSINDSSKSNSNNSNTSNNSDNPFDNIDFNTILKMKSVMDSLNNKNDPDSNLLYSLKPYLRKSRQDKLDQYINILKRSQISKLFNQNDSNDSKES